MYATRRIFPVVHLVVACLDTITDECYRYKLIRCVRDILFDMLLASRQRSFIFPSRGGKGLRPRNWAPQLTELADVRSPYSCTTFGAEFSAHVVMPNKTHN